MYPQLSKFVPVNGTHLKILRDCGERYQRKHDIGDIQEWNPFNGTIRKQKPAAMRSCVRRKVCAAGDVNYDNLIMWKSKGIKRLNVTSYVYPSN